MSDLWPLVAWPLAAACAAALPLAYFGLFLVERRAVFLSVTLAQAAFAGSAAAALLGTSPRLTALAAVALALLITALLGRDRGGLPEDARLGVLYVTLGAAAVVILARAPHGGPDESSMLFGSLLGVGPRDAAVLASTAAAAAAVAAPLHRRFLAVTFDPETSRASGLPVRSLELVFSGALGGVLALAIGQVGVLLAFAYLVMPAAAARGFARGTTGAVLWSLGLALCGTLAGTWASVLWDLPTGPAICLALAAPLPLARLAWRLGG